jgi:hypothetical protein
MSNPSTPAEQFEKFRSQVNWAQEQAGFPTFVVLAGYFEDEQRFFAAHMAMTVDSTAKNEISLQPLLAATFTACIRARCEQYLRQILSMLTDQARTTNAPEADIKTMVGEFENAFRQRMAVEEANFLSAWNPAPE